MSDATVDEDGIAEKKPSKLPLIIGLVLALAGGGGGFFAVQSGLLGLGNTQSEEAHAPTDHAEPHVETKALPDVAFVEVPPVLISLGPNAQADHLRFRASLEVPAQYKSEVEKILPRIQDVLNSYLRALEAQDIEAQGALVRLRGQMLRRIKLVAGEGRVRDLLVLEFVLN
ncbi:flagellar basal body-associated FliL family protein [Mameliella sediminis]|uniref:flagellar basal body-associated FliL family protein n=1 Tax=Mameliella sediminis TaxID=2836866 RepID=UPI001C447870|nr:flagellar basal body-associated FliL family protein [Mameliella sediminis]MBV7395427.1 flagellar basal body-associated FliL family protein [Mameliella sediminis]MBY6114130.1 flagellar basal body-associated FliL family protein [Antarctobacter heliothermus]MBY6142522.1 flagellar basal body-associated FliL family protein [Mameliella alba]MCA0953753.1 flagellar basal body-associated FliL family protein [Mameliella alba]